MKKFYGRTAPGTGGFKVKVETEAVPFRRRCAGRNAKPERELNTLFGPRHIVRRKFSKEGFGEFFFVAVIFGTFFLVICW